MSSCAGPEKTATRHRRPGKLAGIAIPALLALLLLLPHFYSLPTWDGSNPAGSHWGWPLLVTGDEPHYLVYANSLFRDGDFDLSNNYRAAHAGENQAGRIWAKRLLEHHVVYYINGKHTLWFDAHKIISGIDGTTRKIVPTLQARSQIRGRPEYGFHPPGVALILTALFKPFGDPEILESGGLLVSGIMMILGMLAFRSILRGLGAAGMRLNVITAIVFLGTPIWHYARTLYSESFTLCFSLTAFALYIGYENRVVRGALVPGVLIGLSVLVRPASLLFCLPLGIELLARKRFRQFIALAIGPAFAVFFLLYLNHAMFGSPFRSAQPTYAWGNPLRGMLGILFSLDHGLIPFAPATLVALFAWPSFLRGHRRVAWLAIGMVVPSLLLVSCWKWWDGGFSYGPRLIVPLIPFLFLSVAQIRKEALSRPTMSRNLAAVLCALSVLINFRAAMAHWKYPARHPVTDLVAQLAEIVPERWKQ